MRVDSAHQAAMNVCHVVMCKEQLHTQAMHRWHGLTAMVICSNPSPNLAMLHHHQYSGVTATSGSTARYIHCTSHVTSQECIEGLDKRVLATAKPSRATDNMFSHLAALLGCVKPRVEVLACRVRRCCS